MRKRQCELTVRLTGEELRSLDEKVKRTIFTREAFCRRVLAGKTNKELFPQNLTVLLRDSRRLCNTLHQLLKIASNTGPKATRLLQAALDEAHRWDDRMMEVYFQDD